MPGVEALPNWLADIFGDGKSKVPCNRGNISMAYDVDRNNPLGEGSFGRVCRARHLVSRTKFAVKEASKKRADGKLSLPEDVGGLRHEMDVMQTLDHPNIVKVIETYEDASNFWLVLELCEGGRVDDFVAQIGQFTEKDASHIMKQVLGATAYMHNRSICHRDLKPQNLLFQSRSPIESNTVKVADFGLACACPQGRELRDKVGSVEYMAPQVLEKRYDLAADLWSCGAVLYLLLCGYPPFQNDSEERLMATIRRGNYVLKTEDWSAISEDAKYLVRGLLKMNANERLTADQACGQIWVRHGASSSTQLKVAIRNLRTRPSFKRRQQGTDAAGADTSVLGKLRANEWVGPVVNWATNILPNVFEFQCSSDTATRSDEHLMEIRPLDEVR
mmetsp:Transcript_63256/g.119723  ORF Transcript_63256/g.119723 Transcript_63256/m.119723 type:complete len:389 (-) Transcript_63256:48-1214(-)